MALFRGLSLILLVLGAFAATDDTTSEQYKSPDPCTLCERPDVQGPKAGELYNGDFAVFCNSCPKAKGITKRAPDKLAKFNEGIHSTTYKSPKPCDLCKRPDVVGPIAGSLYNDDFKHFCRKCPSEFDQGKLGIDAIETPSLEDDVVAEGNERLPTAMGIVFSAFFLGAFAQLYRGVYKNNRVTSLNNAV